MVRKSKFLVLRAALLIGVCHAPYANAQAVSLPQGVTAGPSVEGVSEYRLPNGLRVLLVPDAAMPMVTVNIVYGVGSVNEENRQTGSAHLLEHMMFKGTPTHHQISKELQDRGISFNATTAEDRTNYFGTFASNDKTLEWLLGLEADRMMNSNILRSDLDSEMTVVRNEMEIGDNSNGRQINYQMHAAAFQWHNYGKSTIGNRADVENTSIDELRAFYHAWYRPDNATLIIAGGINPATTLNMVSKAFGAIPKPSTPLAQPRTVEPPQQGEREITLRRTGETGSVAIAYHVPAVSHPDGVALAVLDDIMTHAPTGRLYQGLVKSDQALMVAANVESFKFPGLDVFSVTLGKDQDAAKAEKTLVDLVEGVGANPITAADVEEAKRRYATLYQTLFLDVNKLGQMLTEYVTTDWRLAFAERDATAALTTADVNRVANTYLKRTNRTVTRLIPAEKPDYVKVESTPTPDRLMAYYKPRPAPEQGESIQPTLAEIKARTHYFTIGDDLKVALLPKKSRGGRVEAHMTFHFGNESSIRGKLDIGSLAGGLLMFGSQTMTREEIQKRFDGLGASGGVGGSSQDAIINLNAPQDHFVEALRLAADVMRHPAYKKEDFDLMRAQKITMLQSQLKLSDPNDIIQDVMMEHFNHFPKGHPLAYRSPQDQLADMERVTLDDVRAFHRDFYGTATGEIVIVGEFDEAALKKELQTLFADWKSPKPYARMVSSYQPSATIDKSFETPGKNNAAYYARSEFPLRQDDPDYAPLGVALTIFGKSGLSSRLGDRIRQKEGLSYKVAASMEVSKDDDSALVIRATTAPENIGRLETAVREEFERLVRDGITQKELDDAKAGILPTLSLGRMSDAGIANTLIKQLDDDPDLQRQAKIEQAFKDVTIEQVNAAIKRHFKPETLSVFVAGDFAGAKGRLAANEKPGVAASANP